MWVSGGKTSVTNRTVAITHQIESLQKEKEEIDARERALNKLTEAERKLLQIQLAPQKIESQSN